MRTGGLYRAYTADRQHAFGLSRAGGTLPPRRAAAGTRADFTFAAGKATDITMLVTMLKSKLHRATVTEADLNYVGSITLDAELMAQAGIFEYEKVQIVNINNGSRFETYVISGEAGSGIVCLNGAAARNVLPGDKIIIMSYAAMTAEEAAAHHPTVVVLGENNSVKCVKSAEQHGPAQE